MPRKIPKRHRERARELFEVIKERFPLCEDPWPIIAFALNDKKSIAFVERIPLPIRAEIMVRNHIRHVKTPYEQLLSQGIEREIARQVIRKEQENKLCELRGTLPPKCSLKEMLNKKFGND